MFRRRDVLKLAASGLATPAALAMAAGSASAQSEPKPEAKPDPKPEAKPPRFDPSQIVDLARTMARQPWRKPGTDLPEPFNNLNSEQYAGIRRKRENLVWGGSKSGFALEPTHRGFIFTTPLQINVVEDGVARRLTYDSADYDFGKLNPGAEKRDLAFGGFRMVQRQENAPPTDVLIFQGIGYFQTLARGQVFGAAARALAIRPVDANKGEEFPYFPAVWIERPVLAANAIVVHAVLDSESVTGAYRFTIRPGDATIVDTECTLFTRAALDHYGLAATQGTFLFGPIDRRRGDDVRPAVYDVAGLQMLSGKNEWIWRPVANRQNLQLSAFIDDNPRGFGLLQRDRDFAQFTDDDNQWEKRPSVWTEPIGDWGPGHVTLLEIPAESQVNQNILAYWRPRAPLAANTEASFAFRQWWCWQPSERPPFATAVSSRSGRVPGAPANARRRRFLVEFNGALIADAGKHPEITANVFTGSGSVSGVRVVLARENNTARVTFDVDAANEPHAELRLLLESAGKPISETWLYRWTP